MASCECMKPELDLFSPAVIQRSVEHGYWVEHTPTSAVTGTGPIEFKISGEGEEYLDLQHTYLNVETKIVQADGSDLPENAAVAPVNLLLQSMFSQVDVSLNEKLITPSTNTYPYRAYLETLLSYGPAAKDSWLQCELWHKDTSGQMESLTERNHGWQERSVYAAQSQEMDLMGKLHVDLLHQDRYLLNKVDMKIRLVRSPSEFVVMAQGDQTYKVIITDISLLVRKVKLNALLLEAHMKALEKGSVKYPVRRMMTKVFSVPQGNLTGNEDNLFSGQLPQRIIIGCVDNDAFNGTWNKNPFNFKHFDINFMALYVGGHQIPGKPLQPNFEKNKFVRCYHSLFSALNKAGQDEGNYISRKEYPEGYTLFAFDLTPDLEVEGHFNTPRAGPMRLALRFARPLPQTINVIVLGEFENTIEIDRDRNILFDYMN